MNGVGRHFARIIPLLSMLAMGCCRDLPSDQLAKFAPLNSPSRIDGYYAGRARPKMGRISGKFSPDEPSKIGPARSARFASDPLAEFR